VSKRETSGKKTGENSVQDSGRRYGSEYRKGKGYSAAPTT